MVARDDDHYTGTWFHRKGDYGSMCNNHDHFWVLDETLARWEAVAEALIEAQDEIEEREQIHNGTLSHKAWLWAREINRVTIASERGPVVQVHDTPPQAHD